ncbi:MAG: glycosyltransferase family 2 protein [Candidatus Lokiarchaeia archaeon]
MGKRLSTFATSLLVAFIAIGIISYFTLGYSDISDTLWIHVYSPLINFLTDWQLFYQILFLIGIVFVVISDALIIPLAFYHYFKTRKLDEKIKFWAPITILIPAYNEEVNLARTIESVYNARYKGDKEIIVINDGSTDKTREIAEKYVEKGMCELINRKNGGKTAAINTGLVSARGEIIVVIDGDGIIKENALEEVVKKFQRPEVGAVAGNIKVGNRHNVITKIQHLEYLRDINIPRRAFNVLKTVMVVPGPLGAFRRDVLYSVGTYDKDTKTEDFDLTIKLLKSQRPEIDVSQTAIAWTESPTTWGGLFKQRLRWYGGMLETLRKHRDATTFSFAKYGNLGRFGGWYTFVSLTLIPLLELFIFAALIGYLAMLVLGLPVSLPTLLISFVSFIGIEMGLTFIALAMERENLLHGLWAPVFIFPYRQFLNVIKILAFLRVHIFKKPIKWDKVERKGLSPKNVLEASK